MWSGTHEHALYTSLLVFCLYCTLLREAREYGYSFNIRLILADLATERGKQAERSKLNFWCPIILSSPLLVKPYVWFAHAIVNYIPVLLLNQPIFLKQHIVCFQEIYMIYPIPGHKCAKKQKNNAWIMGNWHFIAGKIRLKLTDDFYFWKLTCVFPVLSLRGE